MIPRRLDQCRFDLRLAVALLAVAAMGTAHADQLLLRDGTVVKGVYAGGTSHFVKIQTDAGVREFGRGQMQSISFDAPSPPAPPTPQPVVGQFTIPAGTLMLVKMTSQVSSQDKAGRRFTCQLAGSLTDAQGVPVVQAGTSVFGRVNESKQAGRAFGRSTLSLSLTELELGGKLVPVMTTDFAETGKSSFRKTARNAAAGAVIGGAIDGGDGAATGAAIGGATAIIRKGDSVTVPVGTVLEFRLTQPLTLTIGG